MIEEGLIVTAMGVATVFSFLCILILAMTIMEKILVFINKLSPEVAVQVATPKQIISAKTDDEIAIAIAATKAL